jgi:hypothetical protein
MNEEIEKFKSENLLLKRKWIITNSIGAGLLFSGIIFLIFIIIYIFITLPDIIKFVDIEDMVVTSFSILTVPLLLCFALLYLIQKKSNNFDKYIIFYSFIIGFFLIYLIYLYVA